MLANWRSGREGAIINSTIVGPNKIFIEIGTGGGTTSVGVTDGSAASIVNDNQYAINALSDTIWIRLPGSQDPNIFDIVVQYNSYVTKKTLTGSWISDGNGIYHLTGLGAQTDGIYVFNAVTRSGICDGTQKVYSRNNIFAGMEWWSASQVGIVAGTYADTFYLDGWSGNGDGSCAATNPVIFDNKDSIVFNSKFNLCSVPNNVLCEDPMLSDIPPYASYADIYTYGEKWNVIPQVGSPAIDKASSIVGENVFGSVTIPVIDILRNPRPFGSGIDWGAFEVGSGADIIAPNAPSGLNVV